MTQGSVPILLLLESQGPKLGASKALAYHTYSPTIPASWISIWSSLSAVCPWEVMVDCSLCVTPTRKANLAWHQLEDDMPLMLAECKELSLLAYPSQ
jgi:hypothetical protein